MDFGKLFSYRQQNKSVAHLPLHIMTRRRFQTFSRVSFFVQGSNFGFETLKKFLVQNFQSPKIFHKKNLQIEKRKEGWQLTWDSVLKNVNVFTTVLIEKFSFSMNSNNCFVQICCSCSEDNMFDENFQEHLREKIYNMLYPRLKKYLHQRMSKGGQIIIQIVLPF